MRLRSLVAAALIGSGAYLSACAPVDAQRRTAATPTAAEALCALGHSSIPLRTLGSGHHLVGVAVNGKPAQFIVDTGAGRSVVHRPHADAFGLQSHGGQQGTAIGAGGATAVHQVSVNDFAIAGTRTSLDHLFAIDLTHVVRVLDPIVGSPVHGIIGQDILQAQHAIIDIRQERLYLKPLAGEPQTGC